MTKDEALKLALEALNVLNPYPAYKEEQRSAAITAIKEALAQTEQEPVATDWERIARVQDAKLRAMCNEAGGFEKLCEVMDKYERITPPQRKPLTDEEMYALARQVGFDSELMKSNHDRGTPSLAETFARAIEAAHGIKGEA